MKDLFLELLSIANKYGEITEADMYAGGNFSSIVFETADETYKFSIVKKEEEKKYE
jgi:hypothetical protein